MNIEDFISKTLKVDLTSLQKESIYNYLNKFSVYKEQNVLINELLCSQLNNQQIYIVCKFMISMFYKRNNLNINDGKFDKVVDSLIKRNVDTILKDVRYILNSNNSNDL